MYKEIKTFMNRERVAKGCIETIGITLEIGAKAVSEFCNGNCPLLKLTGRLGLSTQNDPRKQR